MVLIIGGTARPLTWVLFENLGAYTLSMASTFHCFPVPVVYYYVREKHRLVGVGGGGGRALGLSPLINFFPVTTLWNLQRGIQCTLSFIGGFTVAHIP